MFAAAGKYIKRVLISLDQLANTLIGGREDETLSSRAGRYDRTQPAGGAPSIGDLLNKIDPGHAEKAVEFDQYGNPQAHGLEDSPSGAALRPMHLFDPDAEGHCQVCKAPSWHPVHDLGFR